MPLILRMHKFSQLLLSAAIKHAQLMCVVDMSKEKVIEFCIPADKTRRQPWLDALNLKEDEVHTRVCSQHFTHGDSSNILTLDLGKRFAFPKKVYSE